MSSGQSEIFEVCAECVVGHQYLIPIPAVACGCNDHCVIKNAISSKAAVYLIPVYEKDVTEVRQLASVSPKATYLLIETVISKTLCVDPVATSI